ncbi:unnamed protein product [Ixodes persulcatus]
MAPVWKSAGLQDASGGELTADVISSVGQEGGQAELPCSSLRTTSGGGDVPLPLRVDWRRQGDPNPEPVYSVRFPGRANMMQGRHQPRHDWAPRAYFSLLGSPAALKVKTLALVDSGVYLCEVTRSDGSIVSSAVRLSVLVCRACRLPPNCRSGTSVQEDPVIFTRLGCQGKKEDRYYERILVSARENADLIRADRVGEKCPLSYHSKEHYEAKDSGSRVPASRRRQPSVTTPGGD